MMHGRGKSDPAIVAAKLVNKAGQLAAESVERRAGAKGKAAQRSTRRAQDRESVSQALDRIRKVAKERKKEKFTALFHHLSLDLLEQAFFELKDNAAPGVDGLTWTDYEADLEGNLEDLFSRLHRGAYRAMPSRRVYIPKPDGRQRPLAIAATASWTYGDARSSGEANGTGPLGNGERSWRTSSSRNPRILHPWPYVRFAVTHPRWEPSA
jgi:RNA-directed DNA polymerase